MKIPELSFDDYETHRFYCQCGSPEHVLDIMIDKGQIELHYYSGCNGCGRGFWDKLKMAFNLLFNRTPYLSWSDFIIRKDDEEEIARIITSFKQDEVKNEN